MMRRILAFFVLTFYGMAAAGSPEPGTRLFLVTFERRAAEGFKQGHDYGAFLAERRREVAGLLGVPGKGLARPGDLVVLFADGADRSYPGNLPLRGDAGSSQVMAAMSPMLQAPGRSDRNSPQILWSGIWRDGFGPQVDEAVRRFVTCPLAGHGGLCNSESPAAEKSSATRGYSRPLLTLPLQLRLALDAAREQGVPPPTEVLWIWVQGGERYNEVNSLVAELDRDFGEPWKAEVVEKYWLDALGTLDIQFLPRSELTRPPVGGGTTLWKVTSSALGLFVQGDHVSPLKLQALNGDVWEDLAPHLMLAPGSVYKASGPLLEGGPLRVLLETAARREARLLAVEGKAACIAEGDAGGEDVPLRFEIARDGASARLAEGAWQALRSLAARCLPPQDLPSRVTRETGSGQDRARLQLDVRGAVGTALREHGIPDPPILATASLARTWRHGHLDVADWFLLGFVLTLLAATLAGLVRLVLFWRSPTLLDLHLLDEAGRPVTAGSAVDLTPGNAPGAAPTLRLCLIRHRGRARRGAFEVDVRATGLQSEIPLTRGDLAGQVVVVRRSGDRDSRRNQPLAFPVRGGPADPDCGLEVARLALYAPDDVVDVDAMPVGEPRKAGVEISCTAHPKSPGFGVAQRVFYVPCRISVGRAPALPPELRIQLLQAYLYRGLRPSPRGDAEYLGKLRIRHRAEPGTAARPYPVLLQLRVRAVLDAADPRLSRNLQVAFGDPRQQNQPLADHCELVVDSPSVEVLLYLWPGKRDSADGFAGQARLLIEGTWSAVRQDLPAQKIPLAPCTEVLPWYPSELLHGIAVDFGTSATRMALLREDMPFLRSMEIAVPKDLFRDPELTGELESEVAFGPSGRLVAAGSMAHRMATRPEDLFPSLKEGLLRNPSDERLWKAVEEIASLLGERIEGPRRRPGEPLQACRWIDGAWHPQEADLKQDFRYLLLVTIPDTFTVPEQERLIRCFRSWEGKVGVLPLREAEATVYGMLVRDPAERPERVLVVDAGAGTVDFAAVRAVYGPAGELIQILAEGLAVSREGGNEYDRVLARFRGTENDPPRRKRETKELKFCDPEANGGELTQDMKDFLGSPHLAAHLERAIADPLECLAGRLALQEAWQPLRFDRVFLSGRGSLALGWKQGLARELAGRGLVAPVSEKDWLRWPPAKVPFEKRASRLKSDLADRLKGAVVHGALALMGHHQTRIQTSQEILRDHAVLLTQADGNRFDARLLAPAGTYVGPEGLRLQVASGDWIGARVVLSSHVPGHSNGTSLRKVATADELWWKALEGGVDGTPAVAGAAEIPLRSRPPGAEGVDVWIRRGGQIECAWSKIA